jgi:hypothetical protein
MHGPSCTLHLASYCRIALLVLIAYFLSCMCVWLFSIDTGSEDYEPEYDCYPSEDRDPGFSADLTGEHSSPATYFCCFASLPYCYLVSRSCQVSYCMLPLQALQPPPPSYSCCLVYRVSLASHSACLVPCISCSCYRYRPRYLIGLSVVGSEIHAYGYICWLCSGLL